MRRLLLLHKRGNNMAETYSETISRTEYLYNELSKMRCEGLFCRKCACYCATKSEFNQHLEEHVKETNSGKENFMSYIEKYICSKCGEQFEVKSDLIIHYNTVCIDALYTCKHCKENCENSPFLQMHLVVHHNYSEEMLRDEGFLTDLDDNPSFSGCSFMTSFKRKAFVTPTPEMENEFDNVISSTIIKASYSRKYRICRKTASTRENLAFNLLDKSHTCYICNESFSRKCVLEIHVQKHTSQNAREQKGSSGISKKNLSIKYSENNCLLTINDSKNGENNSSVDKVLLSNGPRPILKQSNMIFRSSIWKKVKPNKKIRGVKSIVSARGASRKNKKTGFSKATTQTASNTKAITQLSDKVADPVAWKKIKLNSKVRNTDASHEKKDAENLKKTKKSKASGAKQSNATPITERKQMFTCEVCKKSFKDGYKLRRHFLIHTGARPYTCSKCKKTFARDDHLKRHIKKVCSKIRNSEVKK